MVNRLLKANKQAYIKIAKEASEEAADDVKKETGVAVKPLRTDEKYVDSVLAEYNPVTGYLYEAEADRKRARLAEALIAAVIFGMRAEYHKELRKFADLWHTQTLQYGETMVDQTRLDTFKKNGIKRVRWVSENDERVCKTCKERNGNIYKIEELPEKPHYRCRCWIEPVKEKDIEGNNGES